MNFYKIEGDGVIYYVLFSPWQENELRLSCHETRKTPKEIRLGKDPFGLSPNGASFGTFLPPRGEKYIKIFIKDKKTRVMSKKVYILSYVYVYVYVYTRVYKQYTKIRHWVCFFMVYIIKYNIYKKIFLKGFLRA